MPDLLSPGQGQGLSSPPNHDDPHASVPEPALPAPLAHDRSADELEAHSIKWNVARIVHLSSGRYALLTHYHAGALDIIKVGTIEEIVDHIPTVEQCIPKRVTPAPRREEKLSLDDLLADIGLT